MAIASADGCFHDEQEQMQIVSLTNLQMAESDGIDVDDDDDDAGLEQELKRVLARLAALQEEDDVLAAEWWDWAEGVEAAAQRLAEAMAQELEDIHRALSSSSSSQRPGEEEDDEAAAELRAEAARVGARRADAEEVAAAARRLREADLRRLAADAETGRYDYILTLTHEELTVAARFEVMAVGMQEWMASLAARLTRGAAEFAAAPGEEEFVAAMRLEAARAEDARSAIARYRAAAAGGGSSRPLAPAGDQME